MNNKGSLWYGFWGVMNIGVAVLFEWDWLSYINLACGLLCFYVALNRRGQDDETDTN